MNNKLILIGLLITALIAVPLTLYLLTSGQQTTNTNSHASASTHIIFTPQSKTLNVGDTAKFDLDIDPGQDNNKNTITFINLKIQYNADALQPATGVGENGTGLVINGYKGDDNSQQNFVELEHPSITCSNQCIISVSLGIQPNYRIDQLQHAFVSLNVQAKSVPDSGTAQITLTGSQVLSIGANDQASDNVLQTADTASITINNITPTPTVINSTTPTPTSSGGGGGGNGGGTTPTPTQQLTCTSLTADQTSTSSAPLSSVFTLAGNAATGNVSKVTFNFGDGTVQDVTSAGGIGTGTVNVQVDHTYQSNGTYTATATLTGDSGGISDPSSCSQTINVGTTGGSSNGGGGTTPTPTSTPLPKTGPGETLLLIGTIGTVIAVGGMLLLTGL